MLVTHHTHTGGERPFRRFIGWRLAGVAAEDAETVRLFFESPQAAPGSTLPAADAAATGAAAAAAGGAGAGAAADGGQELGARPNGAAAAATASDGDGSSRDDEQLQGPQPRRGSNLAPHWLGGGAVATPGDDGHEEQMLVDAAAAAAAPDGDGAGGDRQRRSSPPPGDTAAVTSLQLPDTRVPAVMRGALLASLPLLLPGGLSPAQAEGVAAACDAAAAAIEQQGAAGTDTASVVQVRVLYGWLQLWCKRGDQQQMAAVVEQLSQLGASAAAAQQGEPMAGAGANSSSRGCQECSPTPNRDCASCWAAVQQQVQQLAQREAAEPTAAAVRIRAVPVAAGAAARDTPCPGDARAAAAAAQVDGSGPAAAAAESLFAVTVPAALAAAAMGRRSSSYSES